MAARWLGCPGASDADIAALEERIGHRLPPSLDTFLRISDGWRPEDHPVYRLAGTRDIDPHQNAHGLAEIFAEYLDEDASPQELLEAGMWHRAFRWTRRRTRRSSRASSRTAATARWPGSSRGSCGRGTATSAAARGRCCACTGGLSLTRGPLSGGCWSARGLPCFSPGPDRRGPVLQVSRGRRNPRGGPAPRRSDAPPGASLRRAARSSAVGSFSAARIHQVRLSPSSVVSVCGRAGRGGPGGGQSVSRRKLKTEESKRL
ncbi:SMI1/KNR4 family protein [Streptomyces sp. AmelKG-E11A]|uniref:SMI1/KNR4 family protein n=1 Tax=Streptomyces sp. AmelKG-E11A TaxID=1100822 RepID=UPI00406C253A